jgi:arylsulfatase A-like enzyme
VNNRAAILALLTAACWGRTPEVRPKDEAKAEARTEAVRPEGPPTGPPVVIFAVLDTVRADHTSLCGYERPTTPTLEEMVKKGAVHTCRAYSPAPWTHPSHASFFTGRSVVEHNAIWVSNSAVNINQVTRVRPLEDSFLTVAERFRDAGYQTVAITANMIVTGPSGLLQGFDTTAIAEEAYALRGGKHLAKMKEVFATLDPNKPLFLFLNFYDAHDPYPAIPDGIKWVPEQEMENLHPNQHDEDHPYYRYVKGLSDPGEERAFLRRVRNGYDWGIHRADAGLGAAFEMLIEGGWLQKGFRAVVTADHGELLGEHRLLRHGGFLYEPVVKVPLLYYDSTAATQPTLPEPASGIWVHDLLLYGQVPQYGPPVHAVSEPNERDVLIGSLGAAIWSDDDKILCTDGERGRYDLKEDPDELHRTPLARHPLVPQLRELCGKVDEMYKLPPPADNPELIKALQAVGYMEE